ncbi:MAG: pilin [Patescibacteria group bacterium]
MKKTFFKVGTSALLSTLIAGVLVFSPMGLTPAFAACPTPPNPDNRTPAQIANDNLGCSSSGFAGFFGLPGDQQTLPAIIGRAIQIILSVLGLVFLILVVYGGILWMVAEGDTSKVSKARGLLFHAVLGLIIVLSAFAITSFVLARLTGAIPN